MTKQLRFEGKHFQQTDRFGGSLLKGNAREKRPLNSKLPLHLVLRADVQGLQSMRHPQRFGMINKKVTDTAAKYGVRIYEYANVGNHIHLLVRVPKLSLWGAFIRELTGRIAHYMQDLGGRKKGRKFWLHKPFTRVVRGWRKAFVSLKEYVILNQWEADGNISRKDALTLKDLRRIWSEQGRGITGIRFVT